MDWPDAQFERLRAAVCRAPQPGTAACPDAEVWDGVMAGVPPPEDAVAWLSHAAACPHCGPLLFQANVRAGGGAALAGDDAAEAMWAALPSSGRDGQQHLGQRLRALTQGKDLTPRPTPSGGWRRRWAYAAAAVVAVGALAVWGPGAARAFLARRLVAQAYGAHRVLALRFAGADYGPLLSPRRGTPEALPGGLLEAEGLLADGLARHPDDVGLLQTRARAALVAGDAAVALADLQRALALALAPAAPGLETDLASAYFERAQAGRDADYGTALDYLGRALAATPRAPAALFNRAWVEEALQDWTGAIADWEAYLAVDARGAWAQEARRHLAADRALVAGHDAAVAAPLLAPAAFAGLATVDAATDARIEEYLGVATTAWLPRAYPLAGPPDAAAQAGLRRLAAWLAQAHHDQWLQRMLGPARLRPGFAPGVAALAAAVAANGAGKPDAALAAARQAVAAFARAGSEAGRARAGYEEVYALHRGEQGERCVAALRRLLPPPALGDEGWLAGEAALEQENCDAMLGRGDPALIVRAAAVARADRYPSLAMRAAVFAAAVPQVPDAESLWRGDRDQLARYWQEPVSAYQAYQLDATLAIYSSQRRQWHAAERLLQAGIERVARTPERSYEAMARQQLADFALQDGDTAEAAAERTRAAALFARLPPTPATANLRALNQLDLAGLDMQDGQVAAAGAELARYRRDQPPVVSLGARALPYFALRGQWELAQGHAAAAEQDERAAIAINESDLRGFARDQERLDWQARARDAYRNWLQVEWALHRDAAATLEDWEWAKGALARTSRPLPAAFLQAARDFDAAGAPRLPEPTLARAALPELRGRQVVSYALFPRELAIWLFDDRGIHGVRVPVRSPALEQEAEAFAAACADPASDPAVLAAEGQQLYRQLLAPVGRWLDPARVLTVEPDGALAAIPFAALRTPDGAYLAQPVMQSPGLAYARWAHPAERVGAAARMLAVASPAAGADAAGQAYPPLPETGAEAREAAAAFGPGSEVLAGAAATPSAILAALPQAELFHFAGHADGDRLLLENGAALSAADFTPQSLARCQLAVLAACSTGAGAALVDASGLVRALLRDGVPAVVATRWQVDSAATRQFSQSFYAALRAEPSVPRALYTAELQLRRQSATAAPYFWAAFAAFGTGR